MKLLWLRELLQRLQADWRRMQQEEKLGVGDQMLVVLKRESEESRTKKEELQ